MSKLFVVGIGPGDLKHMTYEAREAIESAEVVVGYKTYLDFVTPLLSGKEVVSTGMTKEVERCREALRIAASGRTVALVSGGDAGIYGMAGLVLELAGNGEGESSVCPDKGEDAGSSLKPEIVVIPGVSALQAAAVVLGAPLMHDFAVISLSDLLTPWDAIEKRLAAAAAADFVVAIYNPRSKGRVRQIERAREILLASRSCETPVGIVRNACREGEARVVTTLADMLNHPIDMFSLVMVGNSATFVDAEGHMITPRGYQAKGEWPKAKGERPEFLSPSPPASCTEGESVSVVSYEAKDHGPKCRGERPESLSPSPLALGPVSPLALGPGASRALMFCGTGSDVGKSVLTAGFCRILRNRGMKVAPFKSQNMALNSAVTPEGGEIGRAQAVQAAACGIAPHTDMNPVLLKPNSDTGSQVIVQGTAVGNMTVKVYNRFKGEVFEKVRESFGRLSSRFDFIVIEGAGSIAEINLKADDIANLKVARMTGAPVILVADIDRGGVFAQIVGTLELLDPDERALVRGVIINKFRGDPSLLTSGIEFVEKRTGVPVLGVVPWFTGFRIPEEDSVALQRRKPGKGDRGRGDDKIHVGVVRLPRISNYTDFDALESEPDVSLHYVEQAGDMEGLDLLILPGSKSTMTDLDFLVEKELFGAIQNFTGVIVGICGGFQMLGQRISDPAGVESHIRQAAGLGFFNAETVMRTTKETHQAEALLLPSGVTVAPGCRGTLCGYEIHMGETMVAPGLLPFALITRRSGKDVEVRDGAVSADGRVLGTYLHGIFDNDHFRRPFLNRIREEKGLEPLADTLPQEDPFDLLAEHLERHLDMERLLALCAIS